MASVLPITDLYIPQQMQGNLHEHIFLATVISYSTFLVSVAKK